MGPRTTWLAAAAICAAALSVTASPARAFVPPASTIDGPSAAILSLGGVAMAPDGTGGLVYTKISQGEPHVFVSRFADDSWQPPQQVDTALPFDSSWPAIGAGDNGRLVVVWSQSYAQDVRGNHIRAMYSATLKPGSRSFDPPILFDANLSFPNATGDQATAELYPSLAMDPVGQAYLTYHVVTDPCTPSCLGGQLGTIYRPGDVFASVRLARLNGETWSVLGDVNRNPAFSVRPGTAENSPQVTIDAKGRGIIAFQEPDSTGFDRIWARRLFGSGIGQILPVSPSTLLTRPVNGDADAFTLAEGAAGAGGVAYRQQTAPGSVLTSTRVLVSTIATPASAQFDPSKFEPPVVIDNGLQNLGAPGLAVTEPGAFTSVFAGAGALQSATGDPTNTIAPPVPTPAPLGATTAGARPGVSMGDDGSLVTAWTSTDPAGRPLVAIDEDVSQTIDNLPQLSDARAEVAARTGGAITNLLFAGAGSGHALVAFQQGVAGNTQVAATDVQGPPSPFNAYAPLHWVRPRGAVITWDPALDGLSRVTYTVTVDGVVRARGLRGLRYRLDPRGLSTRSYSVVVLAQDTVGQQRLSSVALLDIDSRPPRVTGVHVHGRGLTVTLSDGPTDNNAGVDSSRSWVNFGDGSGRQAVQLFWFPSAYAAATHTYRAPGTYRVTVRAVDGAGNQRTTSYRVTVR